MMQSVERAKVVAKGAEAERVQRHALAQLLQLHHTSSTTAAVAAASSRPGAGGVCSRHSSKLIRQPRARYGEDAVEL